MTEGAITHITILVILFSVLILFFYNIVASLNKTKDDTLGDVICRVIIEHPILVFMAGFIQGHLFWN
jgi:hypothetical protein